MMLMNLTFPLRSTHEIRSLTHGSPLVFARAAAARVYFTMM